jgi:hypothetical protein
MFRVLACAVIALNALVVFADEQLTVDLAYARASADIALRKAKAEIGLPACSALECKVAEQKAAEKIHMALAERLKIPPPVLVPVTPPTPGVSRDGLTFTDTSGRVWRRLQPSGPFYPNKTDCPDGKCPNKR